MYRRVVGLISIKEERTVSQWIGFHIHRHFSESTSNMLEASSGTRNILEWLVVVHIRDITYVNCTLVLSDSRREESTEWVVWARRECAPLAVYEREECESGAPAGRKVPHRDVRVATHNTTCLQWSRNSCTVRVCILYSTVDYSFAAFRC